MRKILRISTVTLTTILLILALASLITAVLLIAFRTGPIRRRGIVGVMDQSSDGSNWISYPDGLDSSILDPLYIRFRTTASGYAGVVTITWKLVDTSSGIEIHTLSSYTTFTLSGNAGDRIFATADGTGWPGFDWGTYANTDTEYYIEAEFYK